MARPGGLRGRAGRTLTLAAFGLASAAGAEPPQNILPPALVPAQRPAVQPSPSPSASPLGTPAVRPTGLPPAPRPLAPHAQSGTPAAPAGSSAPQTVAVPVDEPVAHWTVGDAAALLQAIQEIDAEGLFPADYQPDALQKALEMGEGAALDEQASRSFDWLVEDLRDGRTPMEARVQWFVEDPDDTLLPTRDLLNKAVTEHAVGQVLASLDPTFPDYAQLKQALADTAPDNAVQRDALRINMDRWRWLPRDLGTIYLITNVPEFQLRLTVNGHIIRTYKTIVGKPGRTATPQLAAKVQSVVFYPTWTVPQSILEHEGLATKVATQTAWAKRLGYKLTTNPDGSPSVVQGPGPQNSLGEMKIDMPNPHAIYLHDTPSKGLFARDVRAFSHGCVRTERAVELGMTMAILSHAITQDQASAIYKTHKNTRVPVPVNFPVYITYFTVGVDIGGQLRRFADIYDRDAAVQASFAAPRQLHTTQRASTEEVIVAQDPL